MKHKNTFSKGLNQDNTRTKYDPASYYDAQNIRITTHDGLSTGSIENENGNSLTFEIPDLPYEEVVTFTDKSTTKHFDQINPKIIGWTTMDRHIIVFTATDSQDPNATPQVFGEGMGQIWRFEYDESTNAIDANFLITGTKQLDPATALRYNGRLNYSIDHRIEAVGRYESDTVGRVYYTDNNNTVRTFNVLDDNLRVVTGTLGTPSGKVSTIGPGETDVRTDVTFAIPRAISVGNGSLTAGGKVGIAYRLVDSEGAVTLYSPVSALVPITSLDATVTRFEDMEGDGINAVANARSVTFRIVGVDTSFEKIEYVALVYTTLGTVNLYQFSEQNVPSDGIATVTLEGSEEQIPIDQVEFSQLSIGIERCKTLDVKDNRLVLGNIRTAEVELPDDLFEARAYRFRSGNGQLRLTEQNNKYGQKFTSAGYISSNGWSSLTAPNFPIDHDAINPFNYLSNGELSEDPNATGGGLWGFGYDYKYQLDLTTVGGEGPYIKYEFVNTKLSGDSKKMIDSELSVFQGNYKAPFTNIAKYGSSTDIRNGELETDGAIAGVPAGGEFRSFHSPIVEANLTGYTRGEIYRFGIQFLDKKGTPTFVKWIGDIKFPEPDDGFPVGTSPTSTMTDSTVELNTLGIKFTVTLPQALLDWGVSAYRIVRAERKEEDRSRLGTGTFFAVDRAYNDATENSTTVFQYLYEQLYQNKENPSPPEQAEIKKIQIKGKDVDSGVRHVADSPFFNRTSNVGFQQTYPETKGAITFFSPLTYFRDDSDYQWKSGDYLKILGYYNSSAQVYTSPKNGGSSEDYEFPGFVHKARFYRALINTTIPSPPGNTGIYSYLISKLNYLENGEVLQDGDPKMPEQINGGLFLNCSYATNKYSKAPLAMGADTCLVELDRFNQGNHQNPGGMPWYNPSLWKFGTNDIFPNSTLKDPDDSSVNVELTYDRYWMKEVAYVRPVTKQYTGATHADRSKQNYMSTNHYQPITPANQASLLSHTFNVYGGDTYVSYFDREILIPYQLDGPLPAGQNWEENYEAPSSQKRMSIAYMMPVESYMNLDLMYGSHWNRDRDGDNFGLAFDNETRRENEVYRQQNTNEGKSFAKDFALDFNNVFPHRLWASEIKFDGEVTDKWRDFSANSYIDVEGTYGPINKVINYQDQLYFFQDRAFGIGSIGERDMVNSATSGAQITVGTGTVLEDFRYLTTTSGTVHQFSVVRSSTYLYHYDALTRKLYRTGGKGLEPLSDLKGLSNFYADHVLGTIRSSVDSVGDTTVKYPNPIGVVSGYDSRHNRVFFTFLSAGNPDLPYFTVSFNEASNAFESFYTFRPSLYMHHDGRMLTVDRSLPGQAYVHDEGVKGSFYGNAPDESYITLMVAPNADLPKVFNNLEYNSEIWERDLNGDYTINIADETISTIQYYNDYQDSNVINVVVPTNVKRRIRHWRHAFVRDQTPNPATAPITYPVRRARFRDYHIFLKLTYDNNNDKRLVLHDIITSYMPGRD